MSAKGKGFAFGLVVGFIASWAWHNSMTGGRPQG